jgi:hypothetical protein
MLDSGPYLRQEQQIKIIFKTMTRYSKSDTFLK